jgi:hypothetical protein
MPPQHDQWMRHAKSDVVGAVAGVLNFIPYLGSATTLAILTLVALVTFDTIPRVLMVAASYLALAAVDLRRCGAADGSGHARRGVCAAGAGCGKSRLLAQ